MENNSIQKALSRDPVVSAKILPIPELAKVLAHIRDEGKTVVHCHGVYDLLHPGHIRHLAEAKRQGDILVVTITADRHVNKGPGRPVFNQDLRAETLASLQSVDFVAINDAPTAIEIIKSLRPNIYVKGSDYANPKDDLTGKIVDEEATIRSVGGRIHFTNDITFSSSALINQNLLPFPPETEAWLKTFRARYSTDDVLAALESVTDLSVLVLGEAIIDEYIFCSGLGKAAKDPILAFLYQTSEVFVGGSIAVANHLGDFCKRVELLTLAGEVERNEEFIRRVLHSKVVWHPVTQTGAPTLRKTRYVDDHTGAKIFELYHMDDDPLHEDVEQELLRKLEELLPDFDVVIVPDYGHGMMTPAVVDLLSRKAKFLVVNTQANAGNKGFNTISKYSRADYVCLAGHEMELETRLRHGSWADKLTALTDRIDCPRFTVTLGRLGSIHCDRNKEPIRAPALAPKVVDRVGAGDAVLSITGLLVAKDTPWDMVALIGNAAGAEMVSDLGNRISLKKASLSKHIVALLK